MENIKKKNKALKIFLGVLLALGVFICGVIVFFNVTHSYFLVYGPSMAPTYNSAQIAVNEYKDGVFVSKIKGYTRGDVVVLDKNYGVEGEQERFVIKRLIAIAGDKIKVAMHTDSTYRIFLIKAGETQVQVLEEEYLQDYSVNIRLFDNFSHMLQNQILQADENGYVTIPDDQIFVLGDNRNNSTDSSVYGTKPQKAVVGVVDYVAYNNNNIYWQVVQQFFGW